MKKIYVFVALQLLFLSAFSQTTIDFFETGGPPGGKVLKIIPTESLIVALVSPNQDNMGNLYFRNVGGDMWQRGEIRNGEGQVLGEGSIIDVAFVAETNQFVAITKDFLYVSGESLEELSFDWTANQITNVPYLGFTFPVGTQLQISTLSFAIYANVGDNLVKFTMDGNFDSVVDIGNGTDEFIRDFVVSGNDMYIALYSEEASEIKYSDDNGDSFSTINTGLPDAKLVGIELTGGNVYTFFANGTAPGGVYSMALGGSTWTQVATEAETTLDLDGEPEYYGLFASQETPDLLFLLDNYNMMGRKVVSESAPISGTWTTVPDFYTGDVITAFASYDVDRGYAGYQNVGVYMNESATWTWASNGLNYLNASDQIKINDTYLALNGRESIYSGIYSQWEKQNLGAGNLTLFHKLSTGSLLALGSHVYRSDNNGVDWDPVTAFPAGDVRVVTGSEDDSRLYAVPWVVGQTDIYLSEDQGATWTIQNITGLPADYMIRKLYLNQENDLFIFLMVNEGTHPSALYRVESGSTSAVQVNIIGMTEMRYFRTFGDAMFAVTNDGTGSSYINYSGDDGVTWNSKKITNSKFKEGREFVILNKDIFFVTNGENNARDQFFYYTADGGDTFNQAFKGYSTHYLDDAFLLDDGRVVVTRENGPTMVSNVSIVRPSEPENFREIASGPDVVYLQWEQSGEPVDRFTLERRDPSDVNFKVVALDYADYGDRRYFIDQGGALQPNTVYAYRLKAQNEGGVNYSLELDVTTASLCEEPQEIPDNRSWKGEITDGPVNNNINIRKIADGFYSITDLTAGSVSGPTGSSVIPGQFYQNCSEPFIIKDGTKLIPNGNGSWDGETLVLNWQLDVNSPQDPFPITTKTITLTLNTTDPAPDAPANLFGFVAAEQVVELRWNAGNYQHKYIIERAPAISGPYTVLDEVFYPNTSYRDSTVVDGQIYHYRVKAQNGNSSPITSGYSPQVASVEISRPNFVLANTVVNGVAADVLSATWNDVDNDGDEDLFTTSITSNKGPFDVTPKAFRNTGGDFEEISGLMPTGSFTGVHFGDYDSDGKNDMILTSGAAGDSAIYQKPVLMKNNGNFSFTKVNASPLTDAVEASTSTVNWIDFNKDGKLDVFLPNGQGKHALFQGGGNGTFTSIYPNTPYNFLNGEMKVQQAIWFDFDGDNDLDVFICVNGGNQNDGPEPDPEAPGGYVNENRLYEYDEGVYVLRDDFKDVVVDGSEAGLTDDNALIKFQSASVADYNNDGWPDIYICTNETGNSYSGNLLFKNIDGVSFERQPIVANSPTELKTSPSFSSSWGDIDNDSDLDLIVTHSFGQAKLYLNNGDETFTKAGDELINRYKPSFSIGASFADYDNNGTLDVVYTEDARIIGTVGLQRPKIKLLKNNNDPQRWLKVKVVGASITQSIGAKVQIWVGDSQIQYREVMSTTSGLGSNNSQMLHFGLGSVNVIDSLFVGWPSGIHYKVYNIPTNQILVLDEETEGPNIVSVSPASGETNVSNNPTISFSFDEIPYPTPGKKIFISRVDGDAETPIDTVAASSGVVADSVMSFTLNGALESLKLYKVSVENEAFQDIYGNLNDESNYNWTFTTGDEIVPVLSYDENLVGDLGIGFDETTISATAVDNVDINTVKLYHRSVGGTEFGELSGTKGTGADINKYSFTISEAFFGGIGMEFYFIANDDAGNETRLPAGADQYFEKLFESEAPGLTFDENGFGEVGARFNSINVSATAVDNVEVASVTLFHRGGGESLYDSLAGARGTGTTWNFTVLETFFAGNTMEYYFLARDGTGNATRVPATEGTFFTKTYETVVPVITHVNDELIVKTGGPYAFVAGVTDNREVDSVIMYYQHLTATAFNAAKQPTKNAANYTFSIAEAEFNGTGLNYYFEATDPSGNRVRFPESDLLTTNLDTEGPAITFEKADHAVYPSGTTAIIYQPSATDNIAVANIKMSYRRLSEQTFKTKTESALVNGQASFTLTGGDFDANGTAIEYFFESTDESGNITTKKDGDRNFITQFQFPDDGVSMVITKSDGEVEGYQIIAIPFVMTNNNIQDNFEELGGADTKKYRFLHYSVGPPERWEEYPGNLNVFSRGKGYFLNSRDGLTVNLTQALAPSETQTAPFTIDLVEGWNQIGNPYLTRINWADVQAANPDVEVGNLIVFTNGAYGASDGLDPFKGGFVLMSEAVSDFVMPISTTNGRKKTEEFTKDLASASWRLPLKLTQQHLSHELTGIGMDVDARLSNDRYDNPLPPRFFNYMEMTTAHPEFIVKRFATDVVPTQDEFVWEFDVEAEHGEMITLSWDNTAFGDNNKQLYLFDEANDMIVNMREETVYYFNPRHTRKMKILFGENLEGRLVPGGLRLGKAFPNPTKGVTNIAFSLPESSTTYNVKLEVYDLLGRKVATLMEGSFPPGYYQAQWDAREENLLNGFYTYRLAADTNNRKDVRSGKLLLNK